MHKLYHSYVKPSFQINTITNFSKYLTFISNDDRIDMLSYDSCLLINEQKNLFR